MNRLFSFFIACVGLAALLFACHDGYEDYSTSRGDVLTFSHDTLSFDTALSTIGSATKRIMVYNPNKKPLLIRSISLKEAGSSGFRINVDGQRGTHFTDVAIRQKDSLYVFVEATLSENNATTPILILDAIVFATHVDVEQQVVLKAYGQDTYLYKEGIVVDSDTTFRNDKPYLIYDSLVVRPNARLTLQEGTTLYLHDKAKIDVYGSLRIEGKPGNPVTIRGDRLDKVLGVPYDLQPGSWGGIRFHADSYDNLIEHACIRNGQYGIVCDSADVSRTKLRISHSTLTNVYRRLLEATDCDIEAVNCEFSNAGGALVALTGGRYRFIHCTLANYFVWSVRSEASVLLSNYRMNAETTAPLPLLQADFLNGIVYGSLTSELKLDAEESETSDIVFNYLFDHCLVKIKENEASADHFIQCLLNEDPKFVERTPENYVYDYRLQETSPAIDYGSAAYMVSPDKNGLARPQGDAPDLGAYEWMPAE